MGASKEKNRHYNKHLTQAQRVRIESGLNRNDSVRRIAKDIGKSPSTVHREIQRHVQILPARANDCAFKDGCTLSRLCGIQHCSKTCSINCAGTCMQYCGKYLSTKCEALLTAPYVCNGCRGFKNCSYERRIYRATNAQQSYEETLKGTRSGFDMTDEELKYLDALVSPLLLQGQSPYHIMESHKDEIDMSAPTFYRIVDSGLLTARNIDLKQKVSRKPRKGSSRRRLHNEQVTLTVSKAGRMWEDFQTYMEENDVIYVQMDCVEGKQEEPYAILTLHYPDFHMQLGRYLDKHDSENVVRALDEIEKALGTELFMETFPVILTDNGQEFSDIDGMEASCLLEGVKRTKIFFCESNRSDEKGACENNHKLIRYVIPKGTSLKDYNQSDITLMMNHINSYRRKKAFGKSPYDVCMDVFPKLFFDSLGLHRIPDDEVTLKPSLLRKRLRARTVQRDHRPENRKRPIVKE